MWLEIHDVTSAEPWKITIVLFIFFICNLKQCLFCFFEFFGWCWGKSKVPVKVVIINEIWSNRLKIDQGIIKLFQNKETLGHALSSWNSITLWRRSTNHLKEILCNSQMFFLIWILANYCVYNSFKNIFLWNNTFHIFYQVICIISLVIFEIENNQVKSCFWNYIYEWWDHL